MTFLQCQLGDPRASRPARAALPAPVEAESLAVPAEDGLGLDDHERAAPVVPEAKEPNPEDPIRALEPDAASPELALEHGYLMTEGQWQAQGNGTSRGVRD